MTVEILDGRMLAAKLNDASALQVSALKAEGIDPCLAVVLVGDDPASHLYVRNKHLACRKVGIKTLDIKKPAGFSQAELLDIIKKLNADKSVHGILVQMPLPEGLDAENVFQHINPKKDVDGFHPVNVGRVVKGDVSAMVPCTPQGILILLKEKVKNLSGLHAVIVGRSHLVGRPLAQLLLQENMTVTIAHSCTKDLEDICSKADVVVAAAGQPSLIKAMHVKKGAIVIDVGINRGEESLVGDVDFASVSQVASAITPVPGGVGPMTIACLIRNTLKCCLFPD